MKMAIEFVPSGLPVTHANLKRHDGETVLLAFKTSSDGTVAYHLARIDMKAKILWADDGAYDMKLKHFQMFWPMPTHRFVERK